MRFWDTSALVPLLTTDRTTPAVTAAFRADPDLIVWWATGLECLSALSRLEREGRLVGAPLNEAVHRLRELTRGWQEIEPAERTRETAQRLLRVHPIRAADALQLAAAIVAAEDHPASLPFVTLDDRLADAASREGFPIVRPATA